MDQVNWVVLEGLEPKIIKIQRGSYPSNGVGVAPEGFEPGDEKFIKVHPTGAISIDFEAWRESRKSKDNFFTRFKEGWKP